MWNHTALAKRLGIDYPIIQGPLGGRDSSIELLGTVSNTGGLGSHCMHAMSGAAISAAIRKIRTTTDRPFAVNLWMPKDEGAGRSTARALSAGLEVLRPYYAALGLEPPHNASFDIPNVDEQLAAILESRPPAFSFVFGVPGSGFLQACRSRDIVTLGAASTVDEAVELEMAGVDCIVASGLDSGGHVQPFLRPLGAATLGTFALLPQVVDRVKLPVVAAGGIADARGVATALALGAQGVQIGTAFLAQPGSAVAPAVPRARTLRRRMLDEMDRALPSVLPYPAQSRLVEDLLEQAAVKGCSDVLSMSVGHGAGPAAGRSAQDLMRELVRETPRILQLALRAAAVP